MPERDRGDKTLPWGSTWPALAFNIEAPGAIAMASDFRRGMVLCTAQA